MKFKMNKDTWEVIFVNPTDQYLMDRTGSMRVATTDPSSHTIYLSSDLSGDFLERVLTHELMHCALFSYGLLIELHRMVEPIFWIEMEEWVCNLIANYGNDVFRVRKEVVSKWTP